jgi:glycerol kinase
VSTTTFAKVPENPEIPLKPDVLAAYEALYDQYEDAIESTTDTVLLEKLNASQQAVADVINANDQAILNQNTDTFGKVLTQIGIANRGIADLKAQIAKIAANIGTYAGILSGIDKVLSLLPGI